MRTGCFKRAAAVLLTVAAGSGLLLGAGRVSAAPGLNPLSATTPIASQ